MGSEFNPDMIKVLKKKVFSAAREGMAISIFAMLWNLDRCLVKEVLDHQTEEDGQTTTPLIIAARNGEEKVIQVLLSNFSVDIEQTGTVKFDGYVIEGATALWCASGAGHFNVVKCLIEHEADVNHPTLTNSTPLRAACFDGRLDIVRYLVEHKSDLTIANKYNNTCLMISCYKGHKDVVAYLLEKGAAPDCRAHCGATALHFSAECGHLNIVRLLIQFGASMPKNDHFMTPLIVAAECGKADVVEYMCSLADCSKEDKIDALELLGATFANDKENYDISRAYYYLKKGMEERFKNCRHLVPKKYYPPVPAYGNRTECQSLLQLELLERDHNALHMESLAIRERILGPDTPEVPHPVIFRGAVFADSARFDRCISLWMHAMKLRQRNNRTISKDLLRFSQVFSQMVHLGVKLQFLHVEDVFEHAVVELERDLERIGKDDEEKDALQEIYQANIHTCLYLLVIALRIEKSREESLTLNKLMYKFLQLKPVLKNGYSSLHMVCDGATLVDDFHVNDVVSFPCAELAVALVKCGADVNCRDAHGNIPLHVIVRYSNPGSGVERLYQIILSLIMAGSHIDIRNYERKVPIQCCTSPDVALLLRQHTHISLKCIAARSIRDNNIQYKSLLPMFLEEFIHLH